MDGASGSIDGDVPAITVDDVKVYHTKIIPLMDIPSLLPALEDKGILTPDIIDILSDSDKSLYHRSNYLLEYLFKRGQEAIDVFIDCLRQESNRSVGHSEILSLLDGDDGTEDEPRSALFQILFSHLDAFESQVDLSSLLNALTTNGVITMNVFLDLQNTDRTVGENLEKLFQVLEKQKNQGFIDLLTSLQKTFPNAGNEKLTELLFEEVNKLSPEQDEISSDNKAEILQLKLKEKEIGYDLHQQIVTHRSKLVAHVNLHALFPSLLKHLVLSKQELAYLSELDTPEQNTQFFDLLLDKELSLVAKFVDCLSESPANKDISSLFSTSSASLPLTPPAMVQPARLELEKYDKMAVFVCGDVYLTHCGASEPKEEKFDIPIQEHRKTLEKHLEAMDFKVKTVQTDVEEDPISFATVDSTHYSKPITKKFEKDIASVCNEGAVVFVFLSGLQYPSKLPKQSPTDCDHEYSGAILRTNAYILGRLPRDSIECQDLATWVELLPKAHVTFLIDTFPSHEVVFDRRQQVSEANIMLNPWSNLTGINSNTVVFFLRPDPKAISRERGRESKNPLGILTEMFIKALVTCVRKTKGDVSHRSLYEGISFYWHACKDGRQHSLFMPAIVGDKDRVFLGKNSIPYQQIFRADLVRLAEHQDEDTTKEMFNFKQLKIPTGTMAGLIQGDQLEICHVLQPSVKVAGHITEAYQLHSLAAVDEGEGWNKLHKVVNDLYQSGEFETVDGSSEFLFVRKSFPLYKRVTVFPQELSRSDITTLKTYIKENSLLLTTVTNKQEAKVVVSYDVDHCYTVEDVDKDVRYPMHTTTIQRVKSMLEIIAWFKYVKGLQPRQTASNVYDCSLTAQQPLLSTATPRCNNFRIIWSSWEDYSPYGLGYEAIMNFSPHKFWTPVAADCRPSLGVIFRNNQIITSIEVRSDPKSTRFTKDAHIEHRKIVQQMKVDLTKETGTSNTIKFDHREPVNCISITPHTSPGTPIRLTMKVIQRLPQGSKYSTEVIGGLSVENLSYAREADWKFNPLPIRGNFIQLSNDRPYLTWSGSSNLSITFRFECSVVLERIEFVDLKGPNPLKEFHLCMETGFSALGLSPFKSTWPETYTFPRPIIASKIVFFPHVETFPSDKPLEPSVKLQLQLYGNPHEEPLDVEDEGTVTFQFNDLSGKLYPYFIHILCLEETGDISFLNEDGINAPTCVLHQDGKTYYPSLKTLLEVSIPKGYKPIVGHIQDLYRVWVSLTKLYIEPFCQYGVHQYHETSCYNVCSQGHRTRVVWDEWDDHQYRVNVKKL